MTVAASVMCNNVYRDGNYDVDVCLTRGESRRCLLISGDGGLIVCVC